MPSVRRAGQDAAHARRSRRPPAAARCGSARALRRAQRRRAARCSAATRRCAARRCVVTLSRSAATWPIMYMPRCHCSSSPASTAWAHGSCRSADRGRRPWRRPAGGRCSAARARPRSSSASSPSRAQAAPLGLELLDERGWQRSAWRGRARSPAAPCRSQAIARLLEQRRDRAALDGLVGEQVGRCPSARRSAHAALAQRRGQSPRPSPPSGASWMPPANST